MVMYRSWRCSDAPATYHICASLANTPCSSVSPTQFTLLIQILMSLVPARRPTCLLVQRCKISKATIIGWNPFRSRPKRGTQARKNRSATHAELTLRRLFCTSSKKKHLWLTIFKLQWPVDISGQGFHSSRVYSWKKRFNQIIDKHQWSMVSYRWIWTVLVMLRISCWSTDNVNLLWNQVIW